MTISVDNTDSANVIAPPPLIYLSGVALGFVLEALLPSASLPGWLRWGVGGALLVVGIALARAFFRALVGGGTTVSPYSASQALVTSGPYRFSRNPGYLGMALVFAGISLMSSAVWSLVALVPTLAVIEFGVIHREERYLGRAFGEEYRAYRARVRRWL
ncbi:MAG TPA: isoprenylcysteine carboxylmethyltransferase family protein [Thermoleophilaceae bacterium]|nr:isoprenylcysteine carboxylmethyltransferase family protein [Thermoleophilaceae bacterium]